MKIPKPVKRMTNENNWNTNLPIYARKLNKEQPANHSHEHDYPSKGTDEDVLDVNNHTSVFEEDIVDSLLEKDREQELLNSVPHGYNSYPRFNFKKNKSKYEKMLKDALERRDLFGNVVNKGSVEKKIERQKIIENQYLQHQDSMNDTVKLLQISDFDEETFNTIQNNLRPNVYIEPRDIANAIVKNTHDHAKLWINNKTKEYTKELKDLKENISKFKRMAISLEEQIDTTLNILTTENNPVREIFTRLGIDVDEPENLDKTTQTVEKDPNIVQDELPHL